MILELGDLSTDRGVDRVGATVTWERADRAPLQLWIATSTPGALQRRLDAFLPACSVIAQLNGERRVVSADPVSPLLHENLRTALAWIRRLSRSDRSPVALDLPIDHIPPSGRAPRHGQFYSGGVDSMSTLYWNHRLTPPDHPHRVGDLIHVDGFEEGSSDRSLTAVRAVACELDLDLVEVTTNLAALDTPDRRFWQEFFYGSFLGSVAQALAGRFTRVTIPPSTGSIGTPKRVGSLPQIDTNCSSDWVTIGHPHFETSRSERIAAIGDWEPARAWLRPCSKQAGARLNCGTCEKCLPTQLTILAAGFDLGRFRSFTADDIEPAQVENFRVFDRELVDLMVDHQAPLLRARGRTDLADAIEAMAERFMTWNQWRDRAIAEVTAAVPEGVPLQVADLGQFELDTGLAKHPLCQHWSISDRKGLTDEITRLRSDGADHLVLFSSAFWWFDQHPWLEPLLDRLGTRLVQTERVEVTRLR